MVSSSNMIKTISTLGAIWLMLVSSPDAFAATTDISQVETFIRTIIKILAGLAGLVATGFFVVGGFTYITSSGSPARLDRAKRTLQWSSIGLAVVIAAFVISDIITSIATQAFGS